MSTNVRTVGLPAELKDRERRVALTPSGVQSVVADGHRVVVQAGAGVGAGYQDVDYKEAGAELVPSPEAAWAADVVVKVKEPLPEEYKFFRPDLQLFAFLHLAAEPQLTRALVEAGTDAFAFETLSDRGTLPLLAPMSEIAGRAAAMIGAVHLSSAHGGAGTLLGGAAGVPPAEVVVIGLGVAGTLAARGSRGLDAHVTGIDVDLRRLYEHHLGGSVDATQVSEPALVAEHVQRADVVVGAALVPGARAPVVVTDEMVASMRPGSVVVDLAIDQGGCVETAKPTSLSNPTYVLHDVVHYCVTNVPGQFPRTASAALSAGVAPRLSRLIRDPRDPAVDGSLNIAGGLVIHPVVAETFPDLPRSVSYPSSKTSPPTSGTAEARV